MGVIYQSNKAIAKAKRMVDAVLGEQGQVLLGGRSEVLITPTSLPSSWGFCFVCSSSTFKECMKRDLFGLPGKELDEMRNTIAVGETKLYLLNFDNMMLFGCFVATSQPGFRLEPSAWAKAHGNGLTPYPAQVRVTRVNTCRVSVPKGLFQSGPMDPTLVRKANAMLGLETPTADKLRPTTEILERGKSSVSSPLRGKPSSSNKRIALPALPTPTANLATTLQAYTGWIENMSSIVGVDAVLPQNMVADANRLVATAQQFLKASRSEAEKQSESAVSFLGEATAKLLETGCEEHETLLAEESKRHAKALKNIEKVRKANIVRAESKHMEKLREVQATHDAALKKIPRIKILREHVERASDHALKAKEREERRRAEEVNLLKVQLAKSHKERKAAEETAAKLKAAAEEVAAQKEATRKEVATKKRAALQAAEDEEMARYLQRLEARKVVIQKMFKEANDSTLQTSSKAEEDFRQAYAEATAAYEKQNREAEELENKLLKLNYGIRLPTVEKKLKGTRISAGENASASAGAGASAGVAADVDCDVGEPLHDDEWETVEGKRNKYVGIEGSATYYSDDGDNDIVDYGSGDVGHGSPRPTRSLMSRGGRSFTGLTLKGPRTEKSKKLPSKGQ